MVRNIICHLRDIWFVGYIENEMPFRKIDLLYYLVQFLEQEIEFHGMVYSLYNVDSHFQTSIGISYFQILTH